jgi:mercuric ion transport protein
MVEHIEQAPSDDISAALEQPKSSSRRTALLAVGGVLGAIGASTCCIIPLAFISAGMGGAWLANVVALAPYQPIFIAIAFACLGAGFYFVYRRPGAAACGADSACVPSLSARVTKITLWGGALLVAAAIAYPYLAPLFIEF